MGGAGGRAAGGTAGSSSGGMGGAGGVLTCGPGVAFKIIPGGPAAGAKFCTSPPNQCGGGAWLTVLDDQGQGVTMGLACGRRNCTSCIAAGCPPYCALSALIPPEGISTTWPGTRWLDSSCGGDLACLTPTCAEHGSYVARICGYALTSTVGTGGASGAAGSGGIPSSECEQGASKTPTCVDVPFEYPPSGVVSGVLDPSK